MKRKKMFNILIFCFLAGVSLLYHSCCETIEPDGPYYLDSNVVKIFAPGGQNSYWVYKNLNTNTLDTFYTTTYKKTSKGNSEPYRKCKKFIHPKVLDTHIPYSEELYLGIKNKTNLDSLFIHLTVVPESYTQKTFIQVTKSYKAELDSGYVYISNKEIQNVNYADVYATPSLAPYSDTFYFAKNVGLIEWKSSVKQYQLVSYKL